jgi:aryl-alcohol dehydrogenase-like predicted oxidoreductase
MTRTMRLTKDDKHPSLPAAMETIAASNMPFVLPRIALGTWAIGGWMWGGSDESDAIRTIRTAIDKGVTLIDTAPVYGFGVSESLVGSALAEGGLRREALIATKVGLEWDRDCHVFRHASAARIRQEVEDSLRRLRTDVIDIYQVHWPDSSTPIEETAETMAALLREGKIRAIGVSNFSPEQMDLFRKVAPLHIVQPPYNIFERAIDGDVLPYAIRNRLTVLAYGSLCRGLLTGAVTRHAEWQGDDLRLNDPKFREPRLGQYLAAVDALKALARERYGRSVLALAVRWVLDRGPTVALWGARRPSQLDPVAEVMGWRLDDAAMAEIDHLLAMHVHDPVGPEFMAPPEHRAVLAIGAIDGLGQVHAVPQALLWCRL